MGRSTEGDAGALGVATGARSGTPGLWEWLPEHRAGRRGVGLELGVARGDGPQRRQAPELTASCGRGTVR